MLVQEMLLQNKSSTYKLKQRVPASDSAQTDDWPELTSKNEDSGPTNPPLLSQIVTREVRQRVNLEKPTASIRSVSNSRKEDEEFQYTRKQKLRMRRNQQSVIGKRQGSTIKSGTKYTELFIFRVHDDVTGQELHDFVIGEDVNIISLDKVSHEESRMSSYNKKC
jgi:hypothetical protein